MATLFTTVGYATWVSLREHVGAPVGEETANARPASARTRREDPPSPLRPAITPAAAMAAVHAASVLLDAAEAHASVDLTRSPA